MAMRHVIGGLLVATLPAFALVSVPGSAEADPPGPGFCPPGLANKNPACMPPGLYKKFYPGDIIPDRIDYRRIHYLDYGLPPPRQGHRYIQIGRDAYLIAEGTQRVIEAINLFDAATR